jgi:hypothetical protein
MKVSIGPTKRWPTLVKIDSYSACFCKTSPFAPKETTWHKAGLKLATEADKGTFLNMRLKMSLTYVNMHKTKQMAYKAANQNQPWSRHPGTWDMSHRWGLLRMSPLNSQMSPERCRGQRAWLWIAIALNPSRMQPSPCCLGIDPLANTRSSGQEWRTIWLQPVCPDCGQSGAVENSPSLWHYLVPCNLCRSAGLRPSRGEWWGMTRGCLTQGLGNWLGLSCIYMVIHSVGLFAVITVHGKDVSVLGEELFQLSNFCTA